MKGVKFNFEELDVWQKAVDFASKAINISQNLVTETKHYRLIEQLESSAASVAMNIAEGKGRYSKKEFIQFLCIARGSLFETITLLIIFRNNGWVEESELVEMKNSADEIGKMLSSLISYIKSSIK